MSAEQKDTPSIDEVRDQIEQDREQLARTVDELSARLDVKARAKHRVDEVRASLTTDDGQPTTRAWTAAGIAVGAVAVVTAVILVRRRNQ